MANLQRLLNLQNRRVTQADAAIARQSQLEAMQQQTLNAQQQAGREQMAGQRQGQRRAIQQAIEQRNAPREGNESGVTRSEDGRVIERRNASGTVIQRELSTVPMNQQAPTGLARQLQGQRPTINAPNLAAQAGTGAPGDIANALRLANQPVVTELQGLRQEINRLASSPRSLTVQTPDPVRNTGQILNQISQQRAKQARL